MANTIERKKKKGGKYEFYIAGDNGDKIKALTVDEGNVCSGQEIDELFFLATYSAIEEERERTNYNQFDPKGNPYTYTEGGGDIEVKALLWRSGELIFEGIKKLVKSIPERQEFVLILEKKVLQQYKLNEEQKMSLAKSYRSGAELYCVIDGGGSFVISPTHQQIFYDNGKDKYILEDYISE